MKNITKEEFESYLRSIGGLESGYMEKYWGDNKVRAWLFKVTKFILYKIPVETRDNTFWKVSKLRIFWYNSISWLLNPLIKGVKPKNPFRSKIYTPSFEINSGWYGLVKNLIEEAIAAGWNKEVCQVKEKFGGLRFYVNAASNEVYDIISKYESLSYKTYEDCGEPGEIRKGSWTRTLCEEHTKK